MQVGNPKDSAWQTVSGKNTGSAPTRPNPLKDVGWTSIPAVLAQDAKDAKAASDKAAKEAAEDRQQAAAQKREPNQELQNSARAAAANAERLREMANVAGHASEIGESGHQSGRFAKDDSFFWGILWLLYSVNQSQPGPTRAAWNMRDCSWDHLLGGVVYYNHDPINRPDEGDPAYGEKIRCTLEKIGALPD
jgi:hypothetical protein